MGHRDVFVELDAFKVVSVSSVNIERCELLNW